jgi:hypothetical protein
MFDMFATVQRYLILRGSMGVNGRAGAGNEVGGIRLNFLRVVPTILLASFLGILASLGACGNVTFVDAPYAPRHISVIYSAQEDVTLVRWRMSATTADRSVGFDLLDQTGTWRPIDFAASLYPGGVAPCGMDTDGLCAQTILPGLYQPPAQATGTLRARNSTFGTLPGDTATFQRADRTLGLRSLFLRGNDTLSTTIGDVIGGDPVFVFPRPLERAMWERAGVCVPGYRPDGTTFDAVEGLQASWPAPAPLSAAGRYCASIRGIMTSGNRGADAPVAVDTLPDVTYGDHVYTVPTERTPFSYQIILDLSIPVADRCQEAVQDIQRLVASTLERYSALRTLPALDLSAAIDPETNAPGTPCRQSPVRSLDASGMAQQVKLSAASWTEQHPRFFLLYFNNLRAPLPDPLAESLYAFRAVVVDPAPLNDFQARLWAFGPPEMSQSFGGWDLPSQDWLTATDPAFVQQLMDFGSQSLPLISEIQDPNEPVPLLNPDQAQQLDGGLIRLCQVSITPVGGTGAQMVGHDANGQVVVLQDLPELPVHRSDPPAYLLSLPSIWAVSAVGFAAHRSHIRYEVCTRYCDHAFTSESGMTVASGWIGSRVCMGPPGGQG